MVVVVVVVLTTVGLSAPAAGMGSMAEFTAWLCAGDGFPVETVALDPLFGGGTDENWPLLS